MSCRWFRCASKSRQQKDICLKGDWTTCSKHDTHSRLSIWPLREHETPHFDNESDIHTSAKNYEESGYGLDLDLRSI